MISFQTAWLKAHYPVEFMAALMTHEMDDSEKTLKNLNECRKQKIQVLPPDVNKSLAGFSVRENKIRYGLTAVKGVGSKAVQAIINEREENGPFEDLEDFAERVDLRTVNKRVFESLIKCGAFDFCDESRAALYDKLDDIIRAAQTLQRERETNQISLFGGSDGVEKLPRRRSGKPEWPVNQKLAMEREALGFYISGHPLAKYRNALRKMGVISIATMREKDNQSKVRLGGVVTTLKLKNTKKGDRYATFILEDWASTVEAIVWPDVYRVTASLLTGDEPVVVNARLDKTDERCNIIVESMESLIEARDRNATVGIIALSEKDDLEARRSRLMEILQKHRGTCPVKVKLSVNGDSISVALRHNNAPVCVNPSEALCDEVEQLFGRPVLTFV
ncbi:MAG: DUF655 domain-containing protein [Candidatus Dadabacteria bacterium]|nr:MAG: DUF655 domain-containing protein [Candidatus Dadabacteria bacterium]